MPHMNSLFSFLINIRLQGNQDEGLEWKSVICQLPPFPTPPPPFLFKLLYIYAAQCLLIASRFRVVNNELYVI